MFYGCNELTGVTIGNGVTSIGSYAFYACGLTNATIPASVTSIESLAFNNCTSLTGITVDTNNPAYSSLDGVLFDENQTTLVAYPGGKVGSYTIPTGVTNIGTNAFYYCTKLTSVTIPNSVTSIGDFTFAHTGLASVVIPDSVVNIGTWAFYSCTGLTNVTIGNSVTNIGDWAFYYCTNLTSVMIGNSVTNIGDWAFYYCTKLTSVIIPDSVVNIGNNAFSYCFRLTSVTIGNGVTSIGTNAFSHCTSIASITIPGSVTNIGNGAFWPSGLIEVYFKGNAPSLGGSYVFPCCYGRTVYYLPGTTGWGQTFGGLTTKLWNPQVQRDASFGVRTNRFGFNITGTSGLVIVVEACTNFATPVWKSAATNTLTGGSSYFSDSQWTNYSSRFYRLRSP